MPMAASRLCGRVKLTLSKRFTATASPKKINLKLVDDMSVTHARRLETTLRSHLADGGHHAHLAPGADVPAGFHLIFFNHEVPETELAADGYDDLQSPKVVGVRSLVRRWLRGSIEFHNATPLTLGADAECLETTDNDELSYDTRKRKYHVTIHRRIYMKKDPSRVCIDEKRTLMYFEASESLKKRMSRLISGPPVPAEFASLAPAFTQTLRASPTLVFRYSALSFNAHSIHYDSRYAELAEGLPGAIVQGPLMVTLILRWLNSCALQSKHIRFVDYEILGSVTVGTVLSLNAVPTNREQTRWKAWISRQDGAAGVDRLVFSADVLCLESQQTGEV